MTLLHVISEEIRRKQNNSTQAYLVELMDLLELFTGEWVAGAAE